MKRWHYRLAALIGAVAVARHNVLVLSTACHTHRLDQTVKPPRCGGLQRYV